MSLVSTMACWLLVISTLLGAGCFAIHAMTMSYNISNGLVNEPYFFMVVLGCVFFICSLLALVIMLVDTLWHRP